MPYARPSLSDLRAQVAQDIASALPGADPLLRFSNLAILGAIQAALAHMHYGYIDWLAQQAIPYTASQEFLEAWAALKAVYRVAASAATGTVTFQGVNGTTLPSGTPLVRGDGKTYKTTAAGVVAGGSVTVPVAADTDPNGLLGAAGDTDAGSILTLGQSVSGIQSNGVAATAFTGGADLETDDSFRSRMLFAYQNPPHGGDADDYVTWAREVPGVTRAWCVPHTFGAGTVTVYVMFDVSEAAHGGFPQGTDGCASGEDRDSPATGDQLAVANHIFPLQPVTALVYVVSPFQNTVNFTIDGIASASTDTKAAIAQAIVDVFRAFSGVTAGSSTVALSYIESAIANISGTAGFVITAPAGNIVSASGHVPMLGTITYT